MSFPFSCQPVNQPICSSMEPVDVDSNIQDCSPSAIPTLVQEPTSTKFTKRKETSDIWTHFEAIYEGDKRVRARCNYCKNTLTAKTASGTTHLWRHFESCPARVRDTGLTANIKGFFKMAVDGEGFCSAPSNAHLDTNPISSSMEPVDVDSDIQDCSPSATQTLVEEPTSTRSTKRKEISDIWPHFEAIYEDNKRVRAQCKYCNNTLTAKAASGTSHLRRHFESCAARGFFKVAADTEGFCSAPSNGHLDTSAKPLCWKATNRTLFPSHLQVADLPGSTRSVYKRDHALITPESQVFSPLPEWKDTLGAYLITPAIGAHFAMYLAKMQDNSISGLPSHDVERFAFVVQGTVTLTNTSGASHKLGVDSYAYLPANFDHSLKCDTSATLLVFERRYDSLRNQFTEQIVGSIDNQPLLETPGEMFELRKLLPTSMPYDFNIHVMDFQPGEFLNLKDVHYNQHGLLLLEGQGIYRLGDSWYPVQAGDAIWMAPFVPQWYAALGKTRSRYLLYKDVNRNPI